jgi:hypothetical protein
MFKLANLIGYGGLVVLAIALLCGAGWLGVTYQRRAAIKAVEATAAAHDARAAAEPTHVHHFDSLLFTRIGQHRELTITQAKLKKLDDSSTHRLPAAPALPADPPRQ